LDPSRGHDRNKLTAPVTSDMNATASPESSTNYPVWRRHHPSVVSHAHRGLFARCYRPCASGARARHRIEFNAPTCLGVQRYARQRPGAAYKLRLFRQQPRIKLCFYLLNACNSRISCLLYPLIGLLVLSKVAAVVDVESEAIFVRPCAATTCRIAPTGCTRQCWVPTASWC